MPSPGAQPCVEPEPVSVPSAGSAEVRISVIRIKAWFRSIGWQFHHHRHERALPTRVEVAEVQCAVAVAV